MPFPTSLDKNGVSVLLQLLSPNKPDPSLVALAAYDVVGYGLHTIFGDVKYLMQLDPALLAKLQKVLQSQQMADLLANLPQYAPALAEFAQLKANGVSTWLAAINISIKYGPAVVKMLYGFVTLWNQV